MRLAIPDNIRSPYLWTRIADLVAQQKLCTETAATLYNLAEGRLFSQNMRLNCVLAMASYDALIYHIKRAAGGAI